MGFANRWLSNQRSYKTYSSFEKMPNMVISNILNGHRHLNMYKFMVEFYCRVGYFILGMFLRFKDKYAL